MAVFSNSNGKSPDRVSVKMGAITIGKPYNYTEIKVDEKTLEEYTGVYENESKTERTITKEGTHIYSQRSGSTRYEIKPYEKSKFFFEDSFTLIEFQRNFGNKVTGLITNDRGTQETWIRTDKQIKTRSEIKIPEGLLSQYVGNYELSPGFIISVTKEGDRIFSQATGQSKVEIFAESETRFFLKVVDAQLEFIKDGSGKISKLILYQGGQKLEGPKIK